MDNEGSDSMIDWILQLDSVPHTSNTNSFANTNTNPTNQHNEETNAYSTLQYTSPSLPTCSTQQPFTMSFPIPYESPSHTDSSNSSGAGSIITKAELFQLYEEEEQEDLTNEFEQQQNQKLIKEQQQQYHQQNFINSSYQQDLIAQPQKDRKSSESSREPISTTNLRHTKRTKKATKSKSSFSNSPPSIHGAEPLSGRLDFRPTMTDQVPENQLKTMSPRERRQLRNKISARNFRNRRKEYMTTLEEELDTCKSENKKLQTDLATLRDKMNKLEDENKQLRLDLVLYEEGIQPAPKHGQLQQRYQQNTSSNSSISSSLPPYTQDQQQQQQQQQPPNNSDIMTSNLSFESSPDTLQSLPSGSSASPLDMNILHDFPQTMAHQQQQYHPHQNQQLQLMQQQQYPPEMASAWNQPLPHDFNLHNMYLSHATMPEWDVSRVLSKAIEYSLSPPLNNISVTDTFQRFPLLAPALMSIVVGHTMTLSPNELSTLTKTSSCNSMKPCNKGKRLGVYPNRSGFDDKRALKIWQLLQPLARRKSVSSPPPSDEGNEKDESNSAGKDKKPDDNDDDDKEDGKDDSLKATLASYAAYFEGKCVVTAYVLGQMSILHGFVSEEGVETADESIKVGNSRLSEIEDSSDDDEEEDEDDNEQDNQSENVPSSSRPSEILPLCNQFKRSKDMYIPVS